MNYFFKIIKEERDIIPNYLFPFLLLILPRDKELRQKKDNLLINIGETFIVFTINENEEKNDIIILKIFTGNEKSEIFEFKPEKKVIIIGRDTSSDIYIEDKMLSRKHCYIYYENKGNNSEEKNNWFIKDGDINGKKSTNDTWLYILEDTLIYDQMIIKTNHNLLRCNCS